MTPSRDAGGLMLNLKFSTRWSFHSEFLFVDKRIRGMTHMWIVCGIIKVKCAILIGHHTVGIILPI